MAKPQNDPRYRRVQSGGFQCKRCSRWFATLTGVLVHNGRSHFGRSAPLPSWVRRRDGL